MRRDLTTWLGTLRTTGRTAKYRRNNRSLKARGASSAISLSGGEPLDQRKMLAVTVNTVGSGMTISLGADNDIAGLVYNAKTVSYDVYDNTTLVTSVLASGVSTIQVLDTKGGGGTGQVFEVRDNGVDTGAISASLGVSEEVETTRIFDDIDVTTKTTITGGYGVTIGSPTIELDDATLSDPLDILTPGTKIEFTGVVTLIGGTDGNIGTGSGAGDIDFVDDILGGEDGAGTLTLTAGTGAITFGGSIGGYGGEDLGGVLINSAKSVSATGKFHLNGGLPTAYDSGLTIADGVNNVDFSNGGFVYGFNGDGVAFRGTSTNSTVKQFSVHNNDTGMVFGGVPAVADLSGTVVDNNSIFDNVNDGIDIYSAAGNLNGEDAFVIGGLLGNSITGNGYDGIYATSSTGVEILNNTIEGNGFDFGGAGINLEEGGEYYIAGNQIGEDVLPNAINGITIDGEDGFYSYAGTVIESNTIQGNIHFGVSVTGVTLDTGEDSILITNNNISNNGFNSSLSPEVGGVRLDASHNIRIIYNLIESNGEDYGNGIDILNGSHGTVVFSNIVAGNATNGVHVVDSSTLANPVRIGDVLPVNDATATTVSVDGDQRAFVIVGQVVYLVTLTDPTDVTTTTAVEATVTAVSYDAVTDETTLTFSSVSGTPTAVSLGNYIAGNGEDYAGGLGHGISGYASGEGLVVKGLEILGNVIVDNGIDGIHLEAAYRVNSNTLSDILIAGNSIGYDPTGVGEDLGNGDDGIEVIGGNRIQILQNYVANNGFPNPSVGRDNNGIEIRQSLYVDIGEDGLGNYIANNADDGVDIKSSSYVSIVDNLIEANGDDGIDVKKVSGEDSSSFISIENNLIRNNGDKGIEVTDANDLYVSENLITGNDGDGARFTRTNRADAGFNTVEGNAGDGVAFYVSNGRVEGNEIVGNEYDGVYVEGDFGYGNRVDILGNIIRENGDDGIDFTDGVFVGEDIDGENFGLSRVSGNTIELNDDNGVELYYTGGVQVGGEFPSDINFINLNGNAGVYATGYAYSGGPGAPSFVVGNEIDSNVKYGIEIDNGEDLIVGVSYDGIGDEFANTIRRNGIAGVYAHGDTSGSEIVNNEIYDNPIGVMITAALGLQVGGSNFVGEEYGNHIFDNGQGVRATGDSYDTAVQGNLIENNLTGATLASVRGLTFGYGEVVRQGLPEGSLGNVVQYNNEGLRGSGLLTGTVVAGNEFFENTKVGIALQSARDLTVGGFGEDAANLIIGSPVGLSASGTMTNTLVISNEFRDNITGIALSSATAMSVGNNTIDSSLKAGISVTGNNADTLINSNTITNTGDGPYAGNGIYLKNARNVDVIGNNVSGSSLAGLYATGTTTGTVVENNVFTDNRIGMFLENATNAVFGGIGEDQGNTIVGGGDPLSGVFRDGILVVGTSTGSSITGTDITDTSTGVWLRDARGVEVTSTAITGSKFYGFNAMGDLTGAKFHDNFITNTVGIGGGLGHAMHLEGAQNLAVYDNVGEDSFGSGIYVTGDTSGTTVTNNFLDGNRVGISLMNATNAAIGGFGLGQPNTVIGGSDAANGVYRDGIQVIGTSTGSSIKGTDISDVTTGVALENATGISVEGNTIDGAQFLGVNASGTLTGSEFKNNTVTNSGGLGALGHGIYLANALGLSITGNSVEDGTGGGLYATGVTTGTTVYDNDLDGNRVGIYLVNATNAVIGGSSAGEDNRIVGGGDASTGDFRDGIVASGTLTGSSITNTSITKAATGITLSAATGLTIASATVTGSQVWGLNASGLLTGTKVQTSEFTLTTTGAGGGAGVLLAAAQYLEITDASIGDNDYGLVATGDCSGTTVLDTTWGDNTIPLIDESTGVPPLDIDPLP